MSKKVVNEEETEVNGIKGQIIYDPPETVDAARAGAYAAGKVDTLYPDEELPEPNLHRIQAPEDLTPPEEDDT